MTRRKAAGLLFGLPIALGFSAGLALAQDPSSTVAKTPPPTAVTTGAAAKPQGLTEPQEQLRPSIGGE
jgi:hypothetical protein